MRFVILSPIGRTGGPEALHQLAHMLTGLDAQTTVLYMKEVRGELVAERDTNCRYSEEYPGLSACIGKDLPTAGGDETVLVIPEVWVNHALRLASRFTVIVWWLSVDNGLLALGRTQGSLDHVRSHPNILHAYQSEYAQGFLRCLGLDQHSLALSDYTRVHSAKRNEIRTTVDSREPLGVCFNPKKGTWLAEVFAESHPDVSLIPLVSMEAQELWSTLHSSCAYIDFGHLPGKDRLPREALKAGTRVFLRRCGDGAYASDWSLPEYAYFTAEDCFTGALYQRLHSSASTDGEIEWHEARRQVDGEHRIFQQECKALIRFLESRLPVRDSQSRLVTRLNQLHHSPDALTLAEHRLHQAEAEMTQIRNSSSWRLTAPFRQAIGALRGAPRTALS